VSFDRFHNTAPIVFSGQRDAKNTVRKAIIPRTSPFQAVNARNAVTADDRADFDRHGSFSSHLLAQNLLISSALIFAIPAPTPLKWSVAR
jgi:hypothetical protein